MKALILLILLTPIYGSKHANDKIPQATNNKVVTHTNNNCTFNNIPLKGKVKFVTQFADIKIKYVDNFADLHVQFVNAFPSDCGQWQEVDQFPDFTVQIVDNFADITVKKVKNFPGVAK